MFTTKEFETFSPLFSKDQFFISFVVEPKLSKKVEGKALEKCLNEAINLNDYGTVNQIGFTFIISAHPTQDQSNRLSYNADSKDLSLQIQLPFKPVEEAEKSQLPPLIAQYILAAIALLPKLQIPNFNCIYMLRYLKQQFKQKKWLTDRSFALQEKEVYFRWVFHFKGGPQFYFNKIVHPEALSYLEIEALGNLLELNIDLESYGTGLKNIYFTLLADDPEDKMEGALIDYNPYEKYIETILPVSYPGLLLMNRQYNRSLIALLFLTSIKFYEKTGILDFETEAFHRDIKALFWAEGWLDETLSKK